MDPAEALLPPASPGLLLLQLLQGVGAAEETRVQRKEVHAAAARLNFTDLVLTSHGTTNSKWLVGFALPFLNQAAHISDTLLGK